MECTPKSGRHSFVAFVVWYAIGTHYAWKIDWHVSDQPDWTRAKTTCENCNWVGVKDTRMLPTFHGLRANVYRIIIIHYMDSIGR